MMNRVSERQLVKLPKWAQLHIRKCYSDIDSLKQDREEIFNTPKDETNVVLPYFHDVAAGEEGDQPLPHRQGVRFYVGEHKENTHSNFIEARLRRDLHGAYVEIHAAGRVLVEPRSTNCAYVRLADRI